MIQGNSGIWEEQLRLLIMGFDRGEDAGSTTMSARVLMRPIPSDLESDSSLKGVMGALDLAEQQFTHSQEDKIFGLGREGQLPPSWTWKMRPARTFSKGREGGLWT